jgi:hypothetical protein
MHDPTVDPRWGKVGKQKITDEGPLPPHPTDVIKHNMETIDGVIRDKIIEFIDKAKAAGQPFFVWYNPTRMHVITHLSPKYEGMRQCAEWIDDRGSRHGTARRQYRRHPAAPQGSAGSTTTQSS